MWMTDTVLFHIFAYDECRQLYRKYLNLYDVTIGKFGYTTVTMFPNFNFYVQISVLFYCEKLVIKYVHIPIFRSF